ncbi:MAG TPA: hypothetical protein VN420_00930 [Candidatus Fimivivens sp.]|nr:hypothetical protein [Candidatus Fimivivens sp.]
MNSILSLFPSTVSREVAGLIVFTVLFVSAGTGIGFLLGRNRLVNVVMSVYAALVFTNASVDVLPKDFPLSGAWLFVALLVVLTLLDRSLFEIHVPSLPQDVLWRVIVTGIVVTGMVTSVLVTLFPKKTVEAFPIPVPFQYFGTPLAEIIWLVVPLLVLLLLNRRSK